MQVPFLQVPWRSYCIQPYSRAASERRTKEELTTANMYSLILTNVCRRSPLSVMTSLFPYRWGSWQVDRPKGHAAQPCLNSPFLRHPRLQTPSWISGSPCDLLQNSPGADLLTSEESFSPLTIPETHTEFKWSWHWKPQLETKQE